MENKYGNFFSNRMEKAIRKLKEKKKEEKKEKKKKKIKKKIQKLTKIEDHTKRVVKLCKKLCKIIPEINEEMLISAAWIHDVGKLETKGLHHFAIVLEKVLPDELIDKDILGIIEQHKGVFNPKSHSKECAILRFCDKIDKFPDDERDGQKKRKKKERKYEEAKEKCKKVLDEIIKTQCFDNESDVIALVDFYKEKKKDAEEMIEE